MTTLDENLLSFLVFQIKELRSQFDHENCKIQPLEEKTTGLRVVREREDVLIEKRAARLDGKSGSQSLDFKVAA